MTFYAMQIEPVPGFGFTGGPQFQTQIDPLNSGNEKRNVDWAQCRHKYTAPFKNISNDAYLAIKRVFLICRGRAHTFLHRDWGDFSASNEPLGTGDGTTLIFQLTKYSTDVSGGVYVRTITKPDVGVVVKAGGTVVSPVVSQLDGTVTFTTAPAAGVVLTWSGEFFIHVRFDNDYLPFSLDDKSNGEYVTNGSVDLYEVLNEDS